MYKSMVESLGREICGRLTNLCLQCRANKYQFMIWNASWKQSISRFIQLIKPCANLSMKQIISKHNTKVHIICIGRGFLKASKPWNPVLKPTFVIHKYKYRYMYCAYPQCIYKRWSAWALQQINAWVCHCVQGIACSLLYNVYTHVHNYMYVYMYV